MKDPLGIIGILDEILHDMQNADLTKLPPQSLLDNITLLEYELENAKLLDNKNED